MASRRKEENSRKRAALKDKKRLQQLKPGEESKYARKNRFLSTNGGWGFEYPSPKPWK